MTSEADKPELDSAEQIFFGSEGLEPGAPVPDDYVDPVLVGGTHPLAQMALLLLIAAFAGTLLVQYYDDVVYALSEPEPIPLGVADELHASPRFDGAELDVPANSYVTIEGVQDRVSAGGDTRFFKLLGAPIYVEDRHYEPPPPRNPNQFVTGAADSEQPYYTGGGRLIPFDQLPKRYNSVVRYYSDIFGVYFCGYGISPELERYINNREGRVRLALLDELGREPTAEELSEALGDATSCQQAYLLVSEATPTNQRYFLVIYGVLVAIVLLILVRLRKLNLMLREMRGEA